MPEFWEEQNQDDRREMKKQVARWGLLFGVLFCFGFFAIWWATSAVNFSASRVESTTGATYKISGRVRDAGNGAPVSWAEIADAPSGRPPLYHTTADRFGAYEFVTLAEPHNLIVSALGYRVATVRVGRAWYAWMPKGTEKLEIKLQKE